jgi:hypothetical protein
MEEQEGEKHLNTAKSFHAMSFISQIGLKKYKVIWTGGESTFVGKDSEQLERNRNIIKTRGATSFAWFS